MIARLAGVLVTATLLAGCQQNTQVEPIPELTLAPPTPAGMETAPPEPVPELPDNDDCDRTASLRPFADRADADLLREPVLNTELRLGIQETASRLELRQAGGLRLRGVHAEVAIVMAPVCPARTDGRVDEQAFVHHDRP